MERYDPRMLTTKGGSLVVTLNKTDPATNHNLDVSILTESRALYSVLINLGSPHLRSTW